MLLSDLDIMTRTVYGEGRNQSYEGMLAIARVILNRNEQGGKDNTIGKTCLRHLQFSCWNAGDPNLTAMLNVTLSDKRFRQCMMACLEAVDGIDITFGARHYHTKAISPPWAKSKKPCVAIGDHLFYNNID